MSLMRKYVYIVRKQYVITVKDADQLPSYHSCNEVLGDTGSGVGLELCRYDQMTIQPSHFLVADRLAALDKLILLVYSLIILVRV